MSVDTGSGRSADPSGCLAHPETVYRGNGAGVMGCLRTVALKSPVETMLDAAIEAIDEPRSARMDQRTKPSVKASIEAAADPAQPGRSPGPALRPRRRDHANARPAGGLAAAPGAGRALLIRWRFGSKPLTLACTTPGTSAAAATARTTFCAAPPSASSVMATPGSTSPVSATLLSTGDSSANGRGRSRVCG